ncbi:hypothetical protein IQ266_15145 [filamentous cyanobacterium LEGE 11480]|uniref:Uncharacterized protein n=1 Tax=Romeriopsis navalis LEGE 11480 TaxID=2777977 RepID=A0A928Z3V2_9CYAN|nr:hypothetical protein [Romeriopsis navalis]MBE9031069.1 hypothetical protein [Romeriopsis navalis LEGE 11480]
MAREASPLTSIIPVEPHTPASAKTKTKTKTKATGPKGTLVLEVQDPDAVAALGEQLSLANELVTPHPTDTPAKTTRSRKRSTTTKAASSKAASTKSTTRKTTTKRTTKATSTTKAKQKNDVEASLKVAITNPTEQQMLERIQQMDTTIAQLQSRLAELTPSAPPAPVIAPTIQPTTTAESNLQSPHLPDWSEPELRPHYTLQEAAQAHAAIEALQTHRKLQTADATEIDAAHEVADRLRQYRTPVELPRRRSRRHARIHPVAASTAPTPLYRTNPTTTATHQRLRRRRPRWRWDIQTFWRNLQALGQSLIPVPDEPGAKIVDVIAWVLASIGLRLVLKLMLQLIPPLAMPLNLLMAVPAIVAAYLAFCVHNSRSDVIYRLLLITLGLFLGSRL